MSTISRGPPRCRLVPGFGAMFISHRVTLRHESESHVATFDFCFVHDDFYESSAIRNAVSQHSFPVHPQEIALVNPALSPPHTVRSARLPGSVTTHKSVRELHAVPKGSLGSMSHSSVNSLCLPRWGAGIPFI